MALRSCRAGAVVSRPGVRMNSWHCRCNCGIDRAFTKPPRRADSGPGACRRRAAAISSDCIFLGRSVCLSAFGLAGPRFQVLPMRRLSTEPLPCWCASVARQKQPAKAHVASRSGAKPHMRIPCALSTEATLHQRRATIDCFRWMQRATQC
mgnify:CR=1 FL=1